MVSLKTLRTLALSFPEVTEEPHFEKTSFRIKKKTFSTYDPIKKIACTKLSEIHQNIFSIAANGAIYPVDNKWGKQGWTLIEMQSITPALFADVLKTAYCEVAPKALAEALRAQYKK